MKQKWGREEYVGDWPSERRVWTIAAFFMSLLSVAAIYVYRYDLDLEEDRTLQVQRVVNEEVYAKLERIARG